MNDEVLLIGYQMGVIGPDDRLLIVLEEDRWHEDAIQRLRQELMEMGLGDRSLIMLGVRNLAVVQHRHTAAEGDTIP